MNHRSQGRYPSVEYIIAFVEKLDCSVDWLVNGHKVDRLHMDGLSGENALGTQLEFFQVNDLMGAKEKLRYW